MNEWKIDYCIKELADADTAIDLRRCLEDFKERYRITHAVLHVTDVPGISHEELPLILTYPEEWVEKYVAENYFAIDPVLRPERQSCVSFDWSSVDLKDPTNSHFFREADTFGVGRHGLTTVLRGPRGERSLFTLTSNLNPADWDDLCARERTNFQVYAINLHEKVMLVSGLRDRRTTSRLSRREAQCLELLARGFVPKQIVASLGISESAIRLYLGSGRRKLRVATMHQAIAKAATLELIRC